MSSDLSAPPIDAEKLEELRDLFGNEEEVVLLFRDFMSEIPGHIDELRQAIESHSEDAVNRIAHSLKGSSGGLGAEGVFETAVALEQCARCENLKDAESHFQRLEQEVERLRNWLTENQFL